MQDLLGKINFNHLPCHVAIIMDGNGRWAQRRGMLRTFGHKNASESIRDTLRASKDLDIPYVTLYAFSSENWDRPQQETNVLMNLLYNGLKRELVELQANHIRLLAIGDTEKLSKKVQQELSHVIQATQQNKGGTLILALNYGSQAEIIQATKAITQKVCNGILTLEDIDTRSFRQHLYTRDIPDVDLIIRTSGEQRISNFLLWQAAYAELYFTEVLWPDFRKKDFFEAIISYQKRERRFGKIDGQNRI
ncbi:MAG: isoprenyl transferase [Flavobacteriales bacterium AspAUS03]